MTDVEISRRERKKEETRQRIFEAAVRLFRDQGFDGTTVDDITERADVGKGTFFNYFPRKDSILAYLSEKRLIEVEANAEVILAGRRSARQKLIVIYGEAASAYQEDRELSRFVLNELMARAFAPSLEQGHGQRWRNLIVRVLESGKKSGEFRKGLDVDRAEAVLTGVYYSLVYTWLNCPEFEMDLQAELEAQLAMVFDGMAGRKERGS
jgi:AcrR family transcriptional regulator